MEEVPRRTRLSRRGRPSLLLGTLASDPPRGRGPHHRHDDRDLPQGRPHRQPCPFASAQPAYHHSTTYAERAPALRRVDTVPDDATCRLDRSRHHRAHRGHHEGQATPRAGLPCLSWHSAAGTKLWLGTPGGGV